MGNDSNPKQLTGSGTTTIGSCFLYALCVNKDLTGTMVVKDGTTTIASFAIGTKAGTYHAVPNGARYASLNITLSASDDVTSYTRIA